MPRPTDSCDALLLRGVDYGESDRVVTLLTDRFGKVSFIARGARRSKKRFAGALEPLQLLHVELTRGGGQLGSLMRADIARSYPRVLSDLGRMAAGFAALELVRELVPEEQDDDASVFALVLEMLAALDAEQVASERLALCFQVRLLSLLGFEPRFGQCGLCARQPAPRQAAEFDPRLGHLVCQRCGGASDRLGATLRASLIEATGGAWARAADAAWPSAEATSARAAIRTFIEHRIGRALRSMPLENSHE